MGDAAARYGISRSTLTAAAQRGHLEARKIGNMWVTTPAAVERWRAIGKHVPGPAPQNRPQKRKPGRPRKVAPP